MSFLNSILGLKKPPTLAEILTMKEKRDSEGLLKALRFDDLEVQWHASLGIMSITDPRTQDATVQHLFKKDLLRSLEILEKIVTASADAQIRRNAIHRVGELSHPRATEVLIKGLSDKDRQVRKFSALLIGGWPGKAPKPEADRAIDVLSSLINDNDHEISKAAIITLGRIGDPRVLPRISTLLKSALEAHRENAYTNQYEAICEALGEIKTSESAQVLASNLSGANQKEIGIIVAALEACGDVGVDAILPLCRDDNPNIRAAAALSLCSSRPDAIAALILLLGDEGEFPFIGRSDNPIKVCEQAKSSLVKIGKPAIEFLRRAMGGENPQVKRLAEEAVNKIS